MLVVPNVEGLLLMPLLPLEEMEKQCHDDEAIMIVSSRALSVSILKG